MTKTKNALEGRTERENYIRHQVENLIAYSKAAYASAKTQDEKDTYLKNVLAMEKLLALPSIFPKENF